jgi:hypothetical protein
MLAEEARQMARDVFNRRTVCAAGLAVKPGSRSHLSRRNAMNLLRKTLMAAVLTGAVVVPMGMAVPQAKADIHFLGYGPYATLEIAQRVLARMPNAPLYWRVQYFDRGPGEAGWYIVE